MSSPHHLHAASSPNRSRPHTLTRPCETSSPTHLTSPQHSPQQRHRCRHQGLRRLLQRRGRLKAHWELRGCGEQVLRPGDFVLRVRLGREFPLRAPVQVGDVTGEHREARALPREQTEREARGQRYVLAFPKSQLHFPDPTTVCPYTTDTFLLQSKSWTLGAAWAGRCGRSPRSRAPR